MAKQLDKDMMRMMSVTERFNYIAAKKQMIMNVSSSKPAPNTEPWVDEDNDDYDSFSRSKDSSNGGEDLDEY